VCSGLPHQGYDLWTRQEEQRREVLREIVRRIGVRGAFDPVVKASGSSIFALVKPVSTCTRVHTVALRPAPHV
jgi:hypothetical protein